MAKIIIEIRGGVIQAVLADPALAKREDITGKIVDFDDLEDNRDCNLDWADIETADGESVYRKNGYVEISMEGCVAD
jgi:hypothetical protein